MADKEETKTEENVEAKTKETEAPEETKEEPKEKKEETQEAEAPEEENSSAGEDEGEDVEIPEKFQDIVEKIENMSVLDLNELVKLLEKKFGVSAAAVAPAAAANGAEAEEEKSEFNVELTSAGEKKIQVIKAVKGALGLGLKEAKDLVESAPAMLKENMPKAEAEELKGQVEEAGGSVELK